jgi:hypothetical protein
MKAKPEVYRVEFKDDTRPALLLYSRKDFKQFITDNYDTIDSVYQLEWRSLKF